MLNHCDADRIAEDFERSERLGAEIVAAEYEPLPPSPPKPAGYTAVLVTRTNVVSQQQWMEWVYV